MTEDNKKQNNKRYKDISPDNALIKQLKKFQPTQILVMGFLFVILIGTILLALPIATVKGQSTNILDALFTSTSAVCVTGLVVHNTLEHWTTFGHIVIIILIQIGGLGFMTFVSLMFIYLGRKISFRERLLIKEALNQNDMQGIVKLTMNIIKGTFIVEGIGALILSFKMIPQYGFILGIYKSIWHSISAFCNAGFDITGAESLMPYVGNPFINIAIMLLIIIGGLGFTVWMDIIDGAKEKIKNKYSFKKMFKKYRLHTKIVLVMTISLILIGFVLIYLLEFNNPKTMGTLTQSEKVYAALFQSVTTRTAGFNTMALSTMKNATKFIMIILMFIGGSPAGTAGGIKTVTLGVLFFTVISELKGRDELILFKRKVSKGIVRRALAILMISMGVVVGAVIMLSIFENQQFMDVFFEVVSAFATVGLTLGITGSLSIMGKIAIIIAMFIGRLGPITIALAVIKNNKRNIENSIKYPEQKIIVG